MGGQMTALGQAFFALHPFEHFVDFCSSLIVVLTCASLIYKPTRDRLKKALTNRDTLKHIEADKKDFDHRIASAEAQVHAEGEAVIVILHSELYKMCRRAIEAGTVSLSELDNIVDMYEIYNKLGGNGTGTLLYKKVCALPVTTEEWESDFNRVKDDNNENTTSMEN